MPRIHPISASEADNATRDLLEKLHTRYGMIRFARDVFDQRGWVSNDSIKRVRAAGYSDGELVEIVAVVGWSLFANCFAHVADLEVDFPTPPALAFN